MTKALSKREMYGNQTLFGDQTFSHLNIFFDHVRWIVFDRV